MAKSVAIELKNITKTFGGKYANKNVSLTVNHGEILSILGENGSGKTTLMNMIAGIYFPDSGQVFIDGEEVVIRSPKDAFEYQIGMIHQHFKLVDVFSAAENIVLGRDDGKKFNMKRVSQEVAEISKKYGFDIDPKKKIYEMSVSEKQTVEIIKTLYRGAQILILDEPTNSLDSSGISLVKTILAKERERGAIILLACHDLRMLQDVSDEIFLLEQGKITAHLYKPFEV